jgi:predicted phosphodiesterase
MQSYLAFGDFHLTEKKPICRKEDDFIGTQRDKLNQIVRIARDTESALICAGDFYDYWNHEGYELVNMVNEVLGGDWPVYGVAGNHELPHHSMLQYNRTPLKATGMWCLLEPNPPSWWIAGFSYGVPIAKTSSKICVQHRMIYMSDPIHGYEAERYDVHHEYERDEYKDYNVVITGDNHKPFIYRKDDKHVWVNCGCVYRTSVTEKDYEPSCWQIILHDDDTVEVIRHKLVVNVDDVDRTEMYLDKVKDSFVSGFADEVRKQVTNKTDFLQTVEELCSTQPVALVEVVNKNIEEARGEL